MSLLRCALLDTALEVEAPDDVLAELAALLPPAEAPGPAAAVRTVVLRDGQVHVDGVATHAVASPELALEALLAALNAAAIEDLQDVAVHAGVVARGGVALGWPGVSGAGKTTLTAACLQAGFSYVSDEALVLRGGRVRRYPKWLSLDARGLGLLGLAPPAPGRAERAVAPGELGPVAADGPALGHLVVLERRPGAAALAPASAAATARLLLLHSFNHYKQPLAAFHAAADAADAASCWTLSYDRPQDGAAALRELVEG